MSYSFARVPLGRILVPVRRAEIVDPESVYRLLGARWYAKGLYVKDLKPGSQIQAREVYRVELGDFVYNRLFAWKGSFALAGDESHGCYVSNEFPCFRPDTTQLDGRYLWWYFTRESAWNEALGLSVGATPTSRNRLKEEKLLGMEIPLPPLAEQRRIVARIEELAAQVEEARRLRRAAAEARSALTGATISAMIDLRYPAEPLANIIAPGSTISYGVLVPGQHVEGGIPFVRVQDLDVHNPAEKPSKSISPTVSDQYSRTVIKGGEVLIAVVGSIGKIGIAPSS